MDKATGAQYACSGVTAVSEVKKIPETIVEDRRIRMGGGGVEVNGV